MAVQDGYAYTPPGSLESGNNVTTADDYGFTAPLADGDIQYPVEEYPLGLGADLPPASIPVVVVISPSVSTPLTRSQVITLQVTDTGASLRRVFVYAVYSSLLPWEVVHDGDGFSPTFTGPANQRTTIVDGYEFSILRDGGWQQSPEIRVLPINVFGGEP